MNINNPATSRTLAALIQNIAADSREQFRQDASQAPDMKTFLKGLNRYKSTL
jgi:hypothetical protein